MPSKKRPSRTGLWLVGARGGLATTLIVGLHLMRRGLVSRNGLMTEGPEVSGLPVPALDDLVVGGHDIRQSTVFDSAVEIYNETRTIPYDKLLLVRDELSEVDGRIRLGTVTNCGAAITKLASRRVGADTRSLRAVVTRIRKDIEEFRASNALDQVVVVNLASTEPPIAKAPEHTDLAALRAAVARNEPKHLRASTLYTMAAFEAGCAYVNFTPSNAALTPALQQLGRESGVPFVGSDGKTGETLVKSALAPMFKYRHLKVLSWQGYNMLGDRDGQILADPENKASKLKTKDSVLSSILGYPLHTHVAIDYVRSLSDLKTAWDFIHFEGFLDYKMSLQFTWQGCDAILAAPLVIDLARFSAAARRRGESGPMSHLACFFKSPLGVDEQDLHFQFHMLLEYLRSAT